MTFQAGLTLAILIATLVLLVGRRMPPDLAALCETLALIRARDLSPIEAFSAFGPSLFIIMPSAYVVGAELCDTGMTTPRANGLQGASSEGPAVPVLVIMLAAGLLSGLLSGTLVVAV